MKPHSLNHRSGERAIARIQVEALQRIRIIRNCGRGSQHSKSVPSSTRTDDDDAEPSKLQIGRRHYTTMDQQGCFHHGHIYVTSQEVKLKTAVRSRTLWTLSWNYVSAIFKARTENGLCFADGPKAKYNIDKLKGRNELFTQIIDHNGLSWQASG